MVEVWARSVHSGARGRRSKFFFGGSGYEEHFPEVLCEAVIMFIPGTYVPLLKIVFLFCSEHSPRAQTTDSNSSTREHAYPQLTTKLQFCRLEAAAGSAMRVWQVRAVLCLVAFTGFCDRSPDHTTTSLPLLLAVRDRIIRAQDSPEPIGKS